MGEKATKEFFQCAKCSHNVLADRKAFNLNNLGVKTWCNTCKKSWEVKSWRCRCKVLWHACSIHRDASEQMRRETASKSQRPAEKSFQTTLRGKRTLEDAEDRGQSKRAKTKTKPDVRKLQC